MSLRRCSPSTLRTWTPTSTFRRWWRASTISSSPTTPPSASCATSSGWWVPQPYIKKMLCCYAFLGDPLFIWRHQNRTVNQHWIWCIRVTSHIYSVGWWTKLKIQIESISFRLQWRGNWAFTSPKWFFPSEVAQVLWLRWNFSGEFYQVNFLKWIFSGESFHVALNLLG